MPRERDGSKGSRGPGDRARSDLPPKKIPYDEDYFGTGEEEGVVRERQADDRESSDEPPGAT